MKTSVIWENGMKFAGIAGVHSIFMDAIAPLGKGSAATPKELVAIGLGGCTAMDVIALLKKNKQLPTKFQIDIDIETSEGRQPAVFESAVLTFNVEGDTNPENLIEAVKLSQTKYCGVSAMLITAFPIDYRIVLNGSEIGSGSANFKTSEQI